MDKAVFPRDKTCAGWVTPQVIRRLGLDIADYSSTRVFQPIRSFRTGMMGGRMVETQYDEPVSYGIRRCEFDHYLLDRCGARVWTGEKAERFERTDGGWMINGSISTRLLIGAGGHFCPVARMMMPPGEKEEVVAAQEIEFEMTDEMAEACGVSAEQPELVFCRDLAGYAWCFRKGRYLNVGMGREGERALPRKIAEFCERMKKDGKIPRDAPASFHGHAYLLRGRSRRRAVDHGVMLIGDAAGLAYAESGEGIGPAVESGIMAAEVALKAAGDYRREVLEAYTRRLSARFGRAGSSAASSGWVRLLKEWLAARLLENGWFARRVLLERWFLRMGAE